MLAWQIRSFALLKEAATIYRSEERLPLFLDALGEMHAFRCKILGVDKRKASDAFLLSGLARELQARFASMELFEGVEEVARMAAIAEAWTGVTGARRAAHELREIARRGERNGGILLAADTWLEAAEAWILAGDRGAARADALHARRLAYCDGPPYSAKLLEERADALIARL